MSEYLEMLEEIEQDEQMREEQEKARFEVTDDRKAEWCLQKIREAESDKQRWKVHYDEQYRVVEESADLVIENMTAMLREYFSKVPHKQTATQENYKLPSGKLVCKKQEPEYKRNDAEMVEWAKKSGNAQYLKVVESVDWAALKKACTVIGDDVVMTESGEVVGGVKAVSRPDIFKVEVK